MCISLGKINIVVTSNNRNVLAISKKKKKEEGRINVRFDSHEFLVIPCFFG